MTAKEHLISVLRDGEWVEHYDPRTRIALCAYAIRINNEVEGYSLEELDKLLATQGYGKEFIKKCCTFVSDAREAIEYYLTRVEKLCLDD